MQQQPDGCQLTHVMSHNLSDCRCSFPKIGMVTVGSVNGLICVLQWSDAFFIFNPVFEEYMALPRPQLAAKSYVLIQYGFGFSWASGEYKVIRICMKRNSMKSYVAGTPKLNHVEIEVYTLGTDQWRTLGQVPCPDVYEYPRETFKSFPSPPTTTFNTIPSDNFDVSRGDLSLGIGFPGDMSPGITRAEKLEWD
ncbi:F-box associated domain containing protein, partial [Tanacetum coccineum]